MENTNMTNRIIPLQIQSTKNMIDVMVDYDHWKESKIVTEKVDGKKVEVEKFVDKVHINSVKDDKYRHHICRRQKNNLSKEIILYENKEVDSP